VAGFGDVIQKLYDSFQSAILLKNSPEGALSSSAKVATSILASNKKKYG
jgi:hypothetical protein